MKLVLVDPAQVDGDVVTLDPRQSRHVGQVLRRRTGDRLSIVVAGEGFVADGVISSVTKGTVRVTLEGRRDLPAAPVPRLSLVVGLLKDDKLELVVRQATELSLSRVDLVRTARSVPQWRSPGSRLARLQEIVRGASEQSGNPWPPALELHGSLDEVLDRSRQAPRVRVVATAQGGSPLEELSLDSGTDVELFVGPEGDFSPEEVSSLAGHGARTVTLAGPVMRSETACAVLAAVLSSRLGRFSPTR